jgi:hypothetical protein
MTSRTVAYARRGYARATALARALPDYLIIGAQKGGTTSLQWYLNQHPSVRRPTRKELHYFTLHADRPVGWYRAHFPVRADGTVSGDATPYYLFHPAVPDRAHAVVPDARLVVLLRDPVNRAHSHYNHEVALGHETLSFEDALAAEEERLAGEDEKLRADPGARSFAHQHHSYVARGRYAEQLERWLALYPREQLLVLVSEELFADPIGATLETQRFLGLPERPPARLQARNVRRYTSPLDDGLHARLAAGFADDNQRLARLLGRDLPWD